MTPMFTVMDMQMLAGMTLPGVLCLITIFFVARYFPGLGQEIQQKIIAWITGPMLDLLLIIGFTVAAGLTFQILS